jgi:Bacterial SH3 domain
MNEAKKSSVMQERKNNSIKNPNDSGFPWLAFGVMLILVIVAVGGWLYFLLLRPALSVETSVAPGTLTVAPRPTPRPSRPPLTVNAPNPTPGGNPNQNVTATSVFYGVVTSKVLNLRETPATEGKVLNTLSRGDIVALTKRTDSWYQTVEGAWVSANYLEVRPTRAEAESYIREAGL